MDVQNGVCFKKQVFVCFFRPPATKKNVSTPIVQFQSHIFMSYLWLIYIYLYLRYFVLRTNIVGLL